MNLFRWKTRTRKWLTTVLTAALTLTLLPAQGRSETYTILQVLVEMGKAKKDQAACCPAKPTCTQGTCTGACTMPCCPTTSSAPCCESCPCKGECSCPKPCRCSEERARRPMPRIPPVPTAAAHVQAVQFFFTLLKKAHACSEGCGGECGCPFHRTSTCGGPDSECRASVEEQAAELQRLCGEQQQTLEQLRAIMTELTHKVSALRQEMQVIRHRQTGHFAPAFNIQGPQEVLPMPSAAGEPQFYHYYVPTFTPQYVPQLPRTEIPRLQSWLPGVDGGATVRPNNSIAWRRRTGDCSNTEF